MLYVLTKLFAVTEERASGFKDGHGVLDADVCERNTHESISEGTRKGFSSGVAGRVLSGKDTERWMRLYVFLLLWNKQLAIVIQQSVQTLQNLCFSQVKFVQNQPVPFSHCTHQWTFPEH